MPWYTHSGPRRKQHGKFQSQAKLGTEHAEGSQHRGWHYSFVMHQTGSGVKRTRYAVSISDPQHNRVAYLRDCSSIQQAAEAAKHWIDTTLSRIAANQLAGDVGALPAISNRIFRARFAHER